MRLVVSLLLLAGAAGGADRFNFSVLSEDAGAWPEILSSIGLQRQSAATARIFVARSGAPASTEWLSRTEKGAILILEGESSLAELFGFRRSPENVRVTSLTDVHQPKLSIVWEKGLESPVFTLPAGAVVRVAPEARVERLPVVLPERPPALLPQRLPVLLPPRQRWRSRSRSIGKA